MDAEEFLFDDRRKRKIIENFSAVSPNIQGAKFTEAFIVETVDLSDLSRFMITSD